MTSLSSARAKNYPVMPERDKSFPDFASSDILNGKVSIPAVLFSASLIVPLYFYVGPLRLSIFLLLLVALFVPMLMLLFSRSTMRPMLPDYLLIFVCVWSTLALLVVQGFSRVLEPIGLVWLQTLGAYLVGRVFVRNINSLKAVLHVYIGCVFILFPFAIVETMTARPFYLEVFSSIGPVYPNVPMDARLGFDRVQGAFEHPILFGIFVVSLFSLAYYGMKRGALRWLALVTIAVSGAMSLSTGALLCLAIQLGLISWNYIFKDNPNKWRNLTILIVLAYVTVDLLSNRNPFHVFVDYLTLNNGTGFYRLLIWDYGFAEVLRNPFFGIAFNDWIRPAFMVSSTVDNFWLLIAMRYGVPAFLALAAGLFIILRRVGKVDDLEPSAQQIRDGFIMSLVGVMVAICSVHLWNATFCWFMFLIGSTVFFYDKTADQKAGVSVDNEQLDSSENAHVNADAKSLQRRSVRPQSTKPQSLKAMRAAAADKRARTLRGGGRL